MCSESNEGAFVVGAIIGFLVTCVLGILVVIFIAPDSLPKIDRPDAPALPSEDWEGGVTKFHILDTNARGLFLKKQKLRESILKHNEEVYHAKED